MDVRGSTAEAEYEMEAGNPGILIVDDNDDNRFTLSLLLETDGHARIVSASGGQEALSLLNSERFDLILLDMIMPDLNGDEVLKSIKNNPDTRDIPVVMISADTDTEKVAKCIELGADDYLPKPFNPTILRARVGAALRKASLRALETRLLNDLNKLNQQLEQRVADQVGEIERMSRLRRFLPPQVVDLIVASGTEKQLESHRREITALFCDLRGFTGFSESSDPEDVMALLRDYHAAIGEIIIKYSGTLERFAGDGVMVIFNDPVPVDNPAVQAVLMALAMRTAIGGMIEKWRDLGHDLGFGVGIAHGFATLGTIGFEGRFDYAAIGTVANVASRLCDEAKPGQILISPRVRQAVDKVVTVEPVGDFILKGIRRPMLAYNVLEALSSTPN
jgi:adenylate cyclase